MSKKIGILCNGISIVVLVMIITVTGLLVVPKLFGYGVYAVLSGSMEPSFHIGSVVYVDQTIQPEAIRAGDSITFYVNQKTVATHRVVEVNKDKREFITKGDANEIADLAPIPFSRLMGKAKYTIPGLGYVAVGVKTRKGLLILVALFLTIMLLQMIPDLLKPESIGIEKGRGR